MEWTPERVEGVCDQIPALQDRPRAITPLPGGLTNHNCKVVTPAGSFVARLSGSDTSLLAIDRHQEAVNTRCAEEAGVGAPYVSFHPDLGALVIGFIEGQALTNEAFRAQADLVPRAARACRQLHAGPRFQGDFDMFRRQATYLTTVREHGFPHPADYPDHQPTFDRIGQALAVHPEPRVPCNNDLLAGNFIDDGEKIWLIDYEYSGNNEPSFELGNFATECQLAPEQVEELAVTYYGPDRPDMLARVRLQALVSQFGWALWGYIQAASNSLDFDFTHWGDERFEGAVAGFRSPDLDSLLDAVS